MESFKIIYIDEQEDDRSTFKNIANSYGLNVIPLHPEPDIDLFIMKIFSLEPNAIIIDYKLKEFDPTISYYGTDLQKKILEIADSFPTLVLTTYEIDALNDVSSEPSLIASKDMMEGDFLWRMIIKIIQNDILALQHAEEELHMLVEISMSDDLTAKQKNRMIELDTFIENRLSKMSSLTPEVKLSSMDNRLKELIDLVKEAINKLQGNVN